MLAHRIIPSLLCRGKQLIKGERFDSWRTVGVATQAVRVHQSRGVDELLLLDIAATPEGRTPDLGLVEDLATDCFMPLSVGGGIRSINDIRDLLNAGADKVVIGTAAFDDYEFLRSACDRFGSQAITVAIDYKDGLVHTNCGKWGLQMNPIDAAILMEDLGAGEILLTCIEREGTMGGYDLNMIDHVSQSVSIPVIANGGCSGYEDMYQAILRGAHAVSAGALFQFDDATPLGAAKYLSERGVEARIP